LLGLAGLLSLIAPVLYFSYSSAFLSGFTVLLSLLVYNFAERKSSEVSLTDMDEFKVLFSQKSVEFFALLTAFLSPVVDRYVAIPVLMIVFLSETVRYEMEAIAKSFISSYAGFEFRVAAVGIGLIGQTLAGYSLFYAVVVVGVITVYELWRTLRTGFEF
jgi:hypothetical protein